jgi:hypothetical protein
MKTLGEIKAAGYVHRDTKWTRGYVSRKKIITDYTLVHEGKGSRQGQYYYDAPSWQSTRYCNRVYWSKP